MNSNQVIQREGAFIWRGQVDSQNYTCNESSYSREVSLTVFL